MADKSGIEWTDATWNPIVGCSVVSPGCTNCYAMKVAAARLDGNPKAPHYAGLTDRKRGVWNGEVALAPQHILTAPLRWRRPRMIFVNSMGDLFHESVPDEWIDRVFAVMALAPQHIYQVLTKRSKRMRAYLSGDWAARARIEVENLTLPDISAAAARAQELLRRYTAPGFPHPLEHVWLGVSVEDQRRADERIPDLLAAPAAVRWISAEPLLGAIDLDDMQLAISVGTQHYSALECDVDPADDADWGGASLDWVVVGGESGPGARPMHPDWPRSLRDQCAAAGVAYFFKQHGDWLPYGQSAEAALFANATTGHRFADGTVAVRVGKSRAGRLLDGIEHNEMPS